YHDRTPLYVSPGCLSVLFCNDTAPTEIYTLSLHDALPILASGRPRRVEPEFFHRASHAAAQVSRVRGDGQRVTDSLRAGVRDLASLDDLGRRHVDALQPVAVNDVDADRADVGSRSLDLHRELSTGHLDHSRALVVQLDHGRAGLDHGELEPSLRGSRDVPDGRGILPRGDGLRVFLVRLGDT